MHFPLTLFKKLIGFPEDLFLLLRGQSLNLVAMIIEGVEILLSLGFRGLPIVRSP
jgi:hypothetical protein